MNNLKCPNCGADITTDAAQNTGKCSYCNSRFAAEKKPTPTHTPSPEPLTASDVFKPLKPIITVSGDKPRPRIKPLWLVLSCFLGPFFFVGYIVLTEIRKKSWDEAHNQ